MAPRVKSEARNREVSRYATGAAALRELWKGCGPNCCFWMYFEANAEEFGTVGKPREVAINIRQLLEDSGIPEVIGERLTK